MRREFKEADIKAVGGLSPVERDIPGINIMMDLAVEAIPAFRRCMESGRGVKQWWHSAKRACRSLREANSESALGFLLRKGVQSEALNWYDVSEKNYTKWILTTGSTGVAEWYAPLYHTQLPTPVENGGRFPEAGIQGEDSNIRNIVFGQVIAIDRTLFDDDQTGQIKSYSSKLGSSMSILESVWATSRFIGVARTYANVTVPASTYTTTDTLGTTVTGPFSSTLYGPNNGNRPSTFNALNFGRLANAYVQLLNAVDPLQNKIIVNPNRLIVSSMDALQGQVLLEPGPWPAVIGPSNTATQGVLGGTTSAAGATQGALMGFPGGWGSKNPFGGMGIQLVVERYFPDWAWAFGEGAKGIVNQERDPMEVIEEAKNAGSYFEFDSIRYRSRKRFNMDWIGGGSRFWWLGNDGSATGTL